MSSGAHSGRMFLVDAHALIFQVFHAIPEMSSPSGLSTNALFGFTRDMLYLLQDKNPDYLICAFDRSEKTFRDALFPQYKANRAPMPDDLRPQIPLIYQLLEAMRIPVLSKEGFEADDLIATVATSAAQRGLDVLVCTTDKDCRQLINDRVRIYSLRKHEILDREALQRDWEIAPEQVVDLQALVGDSVDNVPGVQGIGLKTAAKLLKEFGTLDNLLASLPKEEMVEKPKAKVKPTKGEKGSSLPFRLSPRLQDNLRNSVEKVLLSRRLVRLAVDVPLELDWEGWKVQPPDSSRMLALFQEWGFHRFADQVRSRWPVISGQVFNGPDNGHWANTKVQGELFPFGANVESDATLPGQKEEKESWQNVYHLVNAPDLFHDFFTRLRQQKRIAVDLETTSLEPRRAEIVGLAFCWQPGEAWYVPLRGPEGEKVLDPSTTLAQLREIFEDPQVSKVNQNIKYDFLVLRQHGITLEGVAGDSMVADYLLHAGERSHNMETLSNRYLNHQIIPITDLIGKNGKNQLRMDQVAPARVAEYSGEDADVAWRLCELLETRLQQEKLDELYRHLEVPLIEVLAELEFNGIRLDVPKLKALSQEMATQLAGIEEEIYHLAGHSFNIASPKQMRQVLFDELKLPAQRKTGITGEASTNQETLERLAALGFELPKKILEQRHIAKLKGTYVDALPDLINPHTGRIHASFNQTVAATGRLSSSDPNLQNIPVRSEQGRHIRQAFIPEAGWQLMTADYSQIELRLLAHFCGDEEMRRAFAEDRDVHASVAAQIFSVPETDVTSEMRRVSKTVNFGVIYGISPVGLGTRLGMTREEATRFIDSYFARYPKVAAYQAELLRKCRRDRYVSTIRGRRREITGIRSASTYQQRNQPEREAINMEIQGSAADLIKAAMLNIYRRLRREHKQARMLLQIHDELVFEVPPEELKPVACLVAEEMTTAMKLDVPLKVDLAAGPNWLDVTEIEI